MATILLIVIAIAAGVIIYTYTIGFLGTAPIDAITPRIRCVDDAEEGFWLLFFEDEIKVDELYVAHDSCEEIGKT